MAKKGKLPKPRDPGKALEELERPAFKWKTVGIIVAAFATLWITAFMIQSVRCSYATRQHKRTV